MDTRQPGLGLAVESTGDVVVVGRATGNARLGLGVHALDTMNYDAFIARIDAQGNTTWDKTFGVPGVYDGVLSVLPLASKEMIFVGYSAAPAQSLDGVPLSASADGAELVVKLDANGKAVWSTGPIGKVTGGSIALGEKGEIAVGGNAYGDADFGQGWMKLKKRSAYVFGFKP